MNHVTCLFVYCVLQSPNPEGQKLMDPSVVGTVGSAAVAAADARGSHGESNTKHSRRPP